MDIKKLNETVDEFVEERQWEQYHTPKNLVMEKLLIKSLFILLLIVGCKETA